jgi:hypothetical protein
VASTAQIPLIADLAATTNVFRLVTLVYPFATLGFVVAVRSQDRRIRWGTTVGIAAWLITAHPAPWRTVVGITMLGAFYAAYVWPRLRRPLCATGIAMMLVLTARAPHVALHPTLGWDRSDPVTAMGLGIGATLPRAAVLAAPQSLDGLRLTTGHAVVADGRSIPFGGPELDEYARRIEALGGFAAYRSNHDGVWRFHTLSIEDVIRLRTRFGATHLLTDAEDPKFDELTKRWHRTWICGPGECPGGRRWAVFEIPVPLPDEAINRLPSVPASSP